MYSQSRNAGAATVTPRRFIPLFTTLKQSSCGASYSLEYLECQTYLPFISLRLQPDFIMVNDDASAEIKAVKDTIAMFGAMITIPRGRLHLWTKYAKDKLHLLRKYLAFGLCFHMLKD